MSSSRSLRPVRVSLRPGVIRGFNLYSTMHSCRLTGHFCTYPHMHRRCGASDIVHACALSRSRFEMMRSPGCIPVHIILQNREPTCQMAVRQLLYRCGVCCRSSYERPLKFSTSSSLSVTFQLMITLASDGVWQVPRGADRPSPSCVYFRPFNQCTKRRKELNVQALQGYAHAYLCQQSDGKATLQLLPPSKLMFTKISSASSCLILAALGFISTNTRTTEAMPLGHAEMRQEKEVLRRSSHLPSPFVGTIFSPLIFVITKSMLSSHGHI